MVLLGCLSGPAALHAVPVVLDWDTVTWNATQTVNGNFGDAGNYTYAQSFDTDASRAGTDLTFTVTENFSVDAVNNNQTVEFNRDHLGDTQSFDSGGNLTLGPYEPNDPANHTFGNASNTGEKLKIVARDYSKNRSLDGYVEIKITFDNYSDTGVTNVTIPLYDIDWRGDEGTSNNEQDRIYQVEARDLNGNVVGVFAVAQPWDNDTSDSIPAMNSYTIVNTANGTVDQIIGGNTEYRRSSGSPVATGNNSLANILNPDGNATQQRGFRSNDSEGWGNVNLTYNGTIGITELTFRLAANPDNTSGGNRGRGWGFEIGDISYEPAIPEPSTWTAGFLLGGLILWQSRRRLLRAFGR